MINLLWIIPLSVMIFLLMIIMGVTLMGITTGNVGVVSEVMKFFKLIKDE